MADEGKQTADSTGDTSASNPEAAGADPGDKDVSASVSKPEAAKTNLTTNGEAGTGPGGNDVSPIGIVFLALYLVVAILLCFYGLIALWPGPSPSGKATVSPTPTPLAAPSSDSMTQTSSGAPGSVGILTPTPSGAPSSDSPLQASSAASPPVGAPTPTPSSERVRIAIFGRQFEIWDEVRLLLIVILAGALGSLVHTVRSVYWYVGNRSLKWSWLPKYVLQPFAGSALAVIFYVVVRGGFFSPQTTFEQTSPFGFAALAAMVGLFSEQAVLKLKKVAETVLEAPAPGADATPQQKGSSTPPDDTTNPT